MKLLLTSAGIRNQGIADALKSLINKPVESVKVGLIPTAQNFEPGNKDFFIAQLTNLQKHGFSWIDIVDPAADGIDWKSRLDPVDIVFVSGGNTFYLMEETRKSGLGDWLSKNIATKVYVGVSAGSIMATPSIAVAEIDDGDENAVGLTDLTGLSFVDFEVSPHTPEFVSVEANNEYATKIDRELYLIDDESAIKVDGKEITVVGEGSHSILNQAKISR
ncbi:MAG TPA: Type 1 glutamine amidotransferase-like domain-containing protein [Candidatus Saccharimonadales bacterium]|nr:Type 1 glutamine amidotransferase-like domain-containing protein [Candidatus Saccharimonadales bacterium]